MRPPLSPGEMERLIRDIARREISSHAAMPGDETDLVQTGMLDSMGWIGVLTGIEELTRIKNFGNPWPEGLPQSVRSLAELAAGGPLGRKVHGTEGRRKKRTGHPELPVHIAGWGYAVGSVKIPISELEKGCRVRQGTIQKGAGIDSLRVASDREDHLSLAQDAVEHALEAARIDISAIDVLIAVSSTFLALPALGSRLHTQLLLPERCAVLDAGGACVGLLNGFRLASAILRTEGQGTALVVASEIHSRLLASTGAPGELRGLFGDGACAFVLETGAVRKGEPLTLGSFTFGCSASGTSALMATMTPQSGFEFTFRGEELARAAVGLLSQIVEQLERISGRSRSEALGFAIHEPNPRLAQIFAQNARVPLGKIQMISRRFGNLGSATCGVSLCGILDANTKEPAAARPLVFMAAVAPGMLWGGTYLT